MIPYPLYCKVYNAALAGQHPVNICSQYGVCLEEIRSVLCEAVTVPDPKTEYEHGSRYWREHFKRLGHV